MLNILLGFQNNIDLKNFYKLLLFVVSMKKVFLCFVFVLLGVSFVSAQYGGTSLGSNLGYGMEQLIDIVEGMLGPFFSVILGGSGDLLFERILFLAILLATIYMLISRMPIFSENIPVIWIITVTISLLATRFLADSALVQTIILPYSVLGVALTSALPLLIYFTFVEKFEGSTVRKMLWIFFIVIFLGLWGARYDQVGNISWIYFITATLAFIFLLFDGTIRNVIVKSEMKATGSENKITYLAKLREELDKLRDRRSKNYYSERDFKRLEKGLMKDLKRATKAKV